jgi:hypothetical protein
MKYNAEQVAFMLHEAIDENREYKSWHVSTQHLMTFVERVVAEEREACAKVCEAGINNATDWDSSVWDQACENRATAIRARGQEGDVGITRYADISVGKIIHNSSPPQRTWVGLTQEEIEDSYNADYKAQTRAIEAKLKERNS